MKASKEVLAEGGRYTDHMVTAIDREAQSKTVSLQGTVVFAKAGVIRIDVAGPYLGEEYRAIPSSRSKTLTQALFNCAEELGRRLHEDDVITVTVTRPVPRPSAK